VEHLFAIIVSSTFSGLIFAKLLLAALRKEILREKKVGGHFLYFLADTDLGLGPGPTTAKNRCLLY
jgi:hypothetical protein